MNTAEHLAGEPAISVIVPIYNVEPYLGECLDSLCGQTLRNIEIIGVDDGSTDGSGALLDEYAAKDKRIIAVHQKNAGVSAARNAGMRLARGEYLAFVDGDDWMDADFCRNYILWLKNTAQTLPPAVLCFMRTERKTRRW